MNTFDSKITSIEREINALKSTRYRSSANLATITKTVTVVAVVKGGRVYNPDQSYIDYTDPVKYGVVTVSLADIGFACCAMATDNSGRTMKFVQAIANGSTWKFKFAVTKGNAQDIADCGGSSSITKNINLVLKVTGTSDFTTSVSQEDY